MTAYIVFKGDDDGWSLYNPAVTATSAFAALRAAVSEAGRFVAVPARSWKPVTVQAVQTTVLKLEEATSKPAEPEAVA